MQRLIPLIAFAWMVATATVHAENFEIMNYDVEIDINKDKSAYITETIDVNFTHPSHGIYREIPAKGAEISDIYVSEHNSKSHTANSINIKIGDPNIYISGPHQYKIQYRYSYFDGKNEFYHNIIGTEWKTNINNVNFRILFPEEVYSSQVGLSIGKHGTAGFDGGAFYNVNGRLVYGSVQRRLSPYEGVTIRVEVPEGFFNHKISATRKFAVPGIFLLTILAFMIWFIHGKDEPVTPFVNFYPIQNLDAIENELAYQGKASTKGIVALLIELAEKGHIKIETHGTSWTLHKLKEPTELNDNQRNLMNAIFDGGTTKVTKSKLGTSRSFYKECQNIIKDVNKKRKKIFYASSISFPLQAVMGICIIGLVLLTALSIFDFSPFRLAENFPLLLFPTIAILVLITGCKNSAQSIFLFIWAAGFGGMPLLELINHGFSANTMPTTIFGATCLVIAGICAYQLPKRNPRGQMFLNHLAGLKKFIEVAEKPKLQQLVEKDPQYFYNILPTAYILGVSDKWIKQFEDIMTITPDWYSGSRLSINRFNSFAADFNSVSIPSTANGGISRSSGGGGHSGGGGGGGGGGSW